MEPTRERVHVMPATMRMTPSVPEGTPRRSMAARTFEPLRNVSEFFAIANE